MHQCTHIEPCTHALMQKKRSLFSLPISHSQSLVLTLSLPTCFPSPVPAMRPAAWLPEGRRGRGGPSCLHPILNSSFISLLASCHPTLVFAILSQLSSLPPGFLRAGEAEAVLPAWLTQLASSPPPLTGSSSEAEWGNTRMLRRLLRSFADSHRHTAVGA
ncbi:unnamed protein product [Closterium sp. NIES-54]